MNDDAFLTFTFLCALLITTNHQFYSHRFSVAIKTKFTFSVSKSLKTPSKMKCKFMKIFVCVIKETV